MSAKAKTISVAGTLCLGVKKATAEIERVSGKPCSVHAAYKALEKGRRINGVSIREVAEPACPSRTGIPLTVRVYQDWTRRLRLSETDSYPCNTPSRPRLLRFNPYTVRHGGQP